MPHQIHSVICPTKFIVLYAPPNSLCHMPHQIHCVICPTKFIVLYAPPNSSVFVPLTYFHNIYDFQNMTYNFCSLIVAFEIVLSFMPSFCFVVHAQSIYNALLIYTKTDRRRKCYQTCLIPQF